MAKTDVIIVLGRGISSDGILPKDPQTRVKKSVELYQAKKADCIIMSGSWSFHLTQPPAKTEAAAMKEFAELQGVPESAILLEERSKDTISNAYFVKTEILIPKNWKNVIVVTSEDHKE